MGDEMDLTTDAILQAVEKCKRLMPPDPFSPFGFPSRLFGMDIAEAPIWIVPKIKLGDAAPVSDEFRAEFNAWLLQMFGTRDLSLVKPGFAYLFGNKVLMRPESISLLNLSA